MTEGQNPLTPASTPRAHEEMNRQERNWAMFCHLSALVGFIGIPFGNIIGPLILWLIKKDQMPLVYEEGRSALNFQISMTIYAVVAALLCFVFIGFLLIVPLIIANLICVIIAAVKVSNGENFVYPMAIQLIK